RRGRGTASSCAALPCLLLVRSGGCRVGQWSLPTLDQAGAATAAPPAACRRWCEDSGEPDDTGEPAAHPAAAVGAEILVLHRAPRLVLHLGDAGGAQLGTDPGRQVESRGAPGGGGVQLRQRRTGLGTQVAGNLVAAPADRWADRRPGDVHSFVGQG